MGSFNTSCFVSHQTIAPGDPVIIIPIAQQKSYSPISFVHKDQAYSRYSHSHSTCYPTRFWEPVGPYLHATYDDYGCVSLSKDQLNLYKLLFFIRSAIKALPLVHEGENPSHDIPLNLPAYLSEKTPELLAYLQTATTFYAPPLELFDQASTVWDYIYEVAQEQRAFWFDCRDTPTPLAYSICHLHTYTELIALTNQSSTWSKESNDMRARFDRLSHPLPFQALLTELHNPRTPSQPTYLPPLELNFALHHLFQFGSYEGSSYPGEHSAIKDIIQLCQTSHLSTDELFDLVKPWLEPHYANSSLVHLNIHFEPLVYASQDYSNEIGSAYSSFVAKVSSHINTNRKIAQYGEPTTYSLLIASDLLPPILHAINNEIANWDAYLDVLSSTPHPSLPNLTTLTFNTSQELDDLQEFLEKLTAELPNPAQQEDSPAASPSCPLGSALCYAAQPYPYSLVSLTQLTNVSPPT